MSNYNVSTPSPLTLAQRLGARLFPRKHQDIKDLPPWAKEAIYCDAVITLSFVDRLRVLVSGRLRCRTRTITQKKPGRVDSDGFSHPLPPKWMDL